jgi:hypothetical protein
MFKKKKILIVRVGHQRDDAAFEKAAKHKSKLMDITLAENTLKLDYRLKVGKEEESFTYDAQALINYIKEYDIDGFDLVLGFIDRPMDLVLQAFGEKIHIISTNNIMELLKEGNVGMCNFILYKIYGAFTQAYLNLKIPHHESPGCLMDSVHIGRDLLDGCVKPRLCEECEARVADENKATVNQMNKELKKIRVPLYVRMISTIKQRTILSMFVAVVASLSFGVLSNVIAAWALEGSIWQGVVTSTVPFVILCILIAPFVIGRRNKK